MSDMAKDYAKAFYNSVAWRKTQAAFMSGKNYICEDCGGAASIVHHIRHITPENIHDPAIILGWDNLKALCIECHNVEHAGKSARLNNIAFDENGNIVKQSNVFLICGSPGSGKSYYVANHKKLNDLIVDMDLICAALMGEPENIYLDHSPILSVALEVRAALYSIIQNRRGAWGRAFVVTSIANQAEITAISREINAEIVLINTPLEECIERINKDPRRTGKENMYINLALQWHSTYRG